MTTLPSFHQDIRRHPSGSIDFDYYRSRVTALRGQAKREARLVRYAVIGLVAITIAFVGVLVAAAAFTYAPNGATVLIQTSAPRFE
jgi:hypothetical protein